MKIVSWNVNGIVACRRKGFLQFLRDTQPDVMCCQEIKTRCVLRTGLSSILESRKTSRLFRDAYSDKTAAAFLFAWYGH